MAKFSSNDEKGQLSRGEGEVADSWIVDYPWATFFYAVHETLLPTHAREQAHLSAYLSLLWCWASPMSFCLYASYC